MKIKGQIGLDDTIEKINRKHNVNSWRSGEFLDNDAHFRFIEKGHRSGENFYAAMGQTKASVILIVFFIWKTDKQALILSARDMTKAERRLYEKT